ncbi:hypothetical protein AB0892_03100 [Streptomyces sp. NPDC005409]|uniref:hypothetical protein n=1 Tax=Streptomyces sp. NPDC005409 TaxID=3155342 RepID=UPI00345506D1
MSHDQPGPYGPQPPRHEPGPYGQQPPHHAPGVFGPPPEPSGPPYGQQGWGPPQQPHPFGQSPYGGAPGRFPGDFPGDFPPPRPAPRRETGLIVAAVFAALAVIAGGAYLLRAGGSDGADNSEVSADSKGYQLVAPESVDAYKKTGQGSAPAELNAEQKKEAADAGVNNARTVSGLYNAAGTDPAKVGGRRLSFDGLYGDIADPATALDHYFAHVTKKGFKGDGKARGLTMERIGSPRAVKPAGFEGALMKGQDVKVTRDKEAGAPKDGAAEFQFPVCAWSDYSTLAGVNVFELTQSMTGGKGASQEEVAALAAELYKTARRKA